MSKQDEQMLYERQEEKIRSQSDAFIQFLTKRGLLGDSDIDDETMRSIQQEKNKVRYHNTELLLKQYRNIAWMVECFPGTIAMELDEPFEQLDQLLDRIDLEVVMGNRKLESRIESIQKTRSMLDRVNEALTILQKKPENGERLYQIIYTTYICPKKLKHNEILYELDISTRHYYRLKEQAITVLSTRLWAAPTKELEYWLDVLTLFNSFPCK